MRYFEYVYLVVAVGLMIFMVSSYKDLQAVNYVGIIVGILISTFMFAFRRAQRIAADKREAEEIKKLEEEIGNDGD